MVRVSGPGAGAIARAVTGALPVPRHARYCRFVDIDGTSIDHGIALFFPAPSSFTGEDVLELQGHGGPVVLDLIVQRILRLGARIARPGEFSERAFLNGKIDLAQAEAIADLIESGSESAARSALRSLDGEFSLRVHAIVEQLVQVRTYTEAAIDFPEDEIDFLADESLANQLRQVVGDVRMLRDSVRQGCLLRDGMSLVLAGRPNAGKSSLLNTLSAAERAIVSELPGTTRDTVESLVQIDGLPIHLVDTAGLRDTADQVESEGVRRARSALARADRALVIVDDTAPGDVETLVRELPPRLAYTIVVNKIDLTGRPPGLSRQGDRVVVAVSARTGLGTDVLRAHLKDCMGYRDAGESTFIARRRHLDAIDTAFRHVQHAIAHLNRNRAGELLAEELRLAQRALNTITGEFSNEDLLDRIFSSFCIGK